MFKSIYLQYSEHNPIGDRQWRYDLSPLWDGPGSAKENKAMVRKAIAFIFKKDKNDSIPCDAVRFDFTEYSLLCEAEPMDVWEGRKIIHVERIVNGSRTGDKYVIDAASLQKQLYKDCDKQERDTKDLYEYMSYVREEEVYA